MEKKGLAQQGPLDRERFLKDFPLVKQELEEFIRKLHALADKVDEVHRKCTIFNLVATSTSALSGILTIAGLAPVGEEACRVLSATGKGLKMTADVTSAVTGLVELIQTSSAKDEANKVLSTAMKKEDMAMKFLSDSIPHIVSLISNCVQSGKDIMENINAMKLVNAKPGLGEQSKGLVATGPVSISSSEQAEGAPGGSVPPVPNKANKLFNGASASLFLLLDVARIVMSTKHLLEGVKAEFAEELRKRARELEERLEWFTLLYNNL